MLCVPLNTTGTMIRGRVIQDPTTCHRCKSCGSTTRVESKHWLAATIVLCWRCTAQRRVPFVRSACHNGFHLWNRKDGNPETLEVSRRLPKPFRKKLKHLKKELPFQRKRCKTTVAIFVCVCVINLHLEVMCIWLMICPKRNRENNKIMNVMKENDAGDPSLKGGLCRCFRKFGQPVEIGSFSWLRLVL